MADELQLQKTERCASQAMMHGTKVKRRNIMKVVAEDWVQFHMALATTGVCPMAHTSYQNPL